MITGIGHIWLQELEFDTPEALWLVCRKNNKLPFSCSPFSFLHIQRIPFSSTFLSQPSVFSPSMTQILALHSALCAAPLPLILCFARLVLCHRNNLCWEIVHCAREWFIFDCELYKCVILSNTHYQLSLSGEVVLSLLIGTECVWKAMRFANATNTLYVTELGILT